MSGGGETGSLPNEASALRAKKSASLSYGVATAASSPHLLKDPQASSSGSSPATSPASRVLRIQSWRNLPDLSQRLIEAGIYGEYRDYRTRYRQWRQGHPKGAAGELTTTALQSNDPSQFEFWYPTPSIFKWRYTLSYWRSILFLLGSLLFTFSAALLYWQPPGSGHLTRFAPNLIGSVLFSVGTYLSYLNLINIATPEQGRLLYFCPDSKGMLAKHVQVSTIIGTVAFFVGALLFLIGVASQVFVGAMSPIWRYAIIDMGNLLGSFGFVLGGLCEMVHNGVISGESTWSDFAWWASTLDFIGGCNFLVATLAMMLKLDGPGTKSFQEFNYLMGSAVYVVSSVLLLLMWRENDFGLTLISQLNLAVKSSNSAAPTTERGTMPVLISEEAPDRVPKEIDQLSMRGAVYIILYCWFAFVAIANCLFREQRLLRIRTQDRIWMDVMMDLCMQVFVVVVISLVLVLHSVVTEVPDEQPYHCAVVTTRILLVAGAMVQTFWFVKFWTTPPCEVVSVT
mmetsp:Transcript_45309/g.116339  ORF Transcript_45309/g.116339 Transcript_45309/m.116339 type:complete len:512 (+) Transcript_45309:129-1664(+)